MNTKYNLISFATNRRGYILVATYLMMAVLSVSAAASLTRTYTFTREAERQKNSLIALEMAEGAVDKAVTQLAASSSYSGTGGYQDFSSGSAKGGYAITVTTPTGAASTIRKIAVTGYAPGNVSTAIGYKTAMVDTYVEFSTQNYFAKAIFAKTQYTNTGNGITDSYISTNGAYNAGTARSNGDVGTNSIVAGKVSLSGNAIIKGNVAIGAGGDTSTVITTTDNASITGSRLAQTTNTVLTTPSTSIASSGTLTISGNTTVTLAAGTYRYTKLSIAGNGRLTTTGDVTVYVTGTGNSDSVSIAGNGTAAYQNLPKNLKIYVTTSMPVSVTGNGSTYAAIYAPLSAVAIAGNGSIYGSIVGNTVSMVGNANFHYDEALGSVVGSTNADPTVLAYVQSGNKSWTN